MICKIEWNLRIYFWKERNWLLKLRLIRLGKLSFIFGRKILFSGCSISEVIALVRNREIMRHSWWTLEESRRPGLHWGDWGPLLLCTVWLRLFIYLVEIVCFIFENIVLFSSLDLELCLIDRFLRAEYWLVSYWRELRSWLLLNRRLCIRLYLRGISWHKGVWE